MPDEKPDLFIPAPTRRSGQNVPAFTAPAAVKRRIPITKGKSRDAPKRGAGAGLTAPAIPLKEDTGIFKAQTHVL